MRHHFHHLKPMLLCCLAASLLGSLPLDAQDVFSGLENSRHPRLLADDARFAQVKELILKGEKEPLNLLHGVAMHLADSIGMRPAPLRYKMDAAGKRLLPVSREALARIFTTAYAYRYTGGERYLHHAEEDINAVCRFPGWNPSHWLDVGEMASAVAIGYDWLYPHLQDSTRANAVRAIREYAFGTRDLPSAWFKNSLTNWNQVCNAGLVCSALAIYEEDPGTCREVLESAVESNRRAAKAIYSPVGAYSEGPVYWCYGNLFQTLLMAATESVLGTDFGLGETVGMKGTSEFEVFMVGGTGDLFNYSDNLPARIPFLPLWYYAARYDMPEILHDEIGYLRKGSYWDMESERLTPLYVLYAADIDYSRVKPMEKLSYFAQGEVPVAVVRTGWEEDDLYLAAKGGRCSISHAHQDVGGFVFEGWGRRWISELPRQEYYDLEPFCKKIGGDLWNMKPESVRWKLFAYGSAQHNIITVNGRDLQVDSTGRMTATIDGKKRKGATFELTPLYGGDLEYYTRTLLLEKGHLTVRDSLKAPQGQKARIRFTLVTPAQVRVKKKCIILEDGGQKAVFRTMGAKVSYTRWSSDPADYGSIMAPVDGPVKESICGFELSLDEGQAAYLESTLRKRRIL